MNKFLGLKVDQQVGGCHQARQLAFDPRLTRWEERTTLESCPLTSTCTLWDTQNKSSI